MTETWRDIPDCPGYDVSDKGRVRSWHRAGSTQWGDAPLDLRTSGQRPAVHLRVDGRRLNLRVAKLVMLAFVGPAKGRLVLHRDDDPANNQLENLRYGSKSDNAFDSVRLGSHFNAAKQQCAHGHPLDGIYPGSGKRYCKTCKADAVRRYRANH